MTELEKGIIIGVDVGNAPMFALSTGEKFNAFPEQVAMYLAISYSVICIETLTGIEFAHLSAHLELIKKYAKLCGKKCVCVPKYFPSSQLCSRCGYRNRTLRLDEKVWICPSCSVTHDRDVNAAVNIKLEGLKRLS